ncbi:MAG TPA: NAD(P)-dependent oxidoreductase [Candidatus Dormibacteraeota bacterium]|nr:NAD(P)-dependent oxidoreductase [Candidatus Dormibacteraeota bacterium]
MKILIIGSNGFMGSNFKKVLSQKYDVYGTDYTDNDGTSYLIDLTKKETIVEVLRKVRPQVIVNCAGIVENSEKANLNPLFMKNLLDSIVDSGLKLKRIITLGSAAEYGEVENDNLSIGEETPLSAKSIYGISKIKESSVAEEFRNKYNIPIIVARIFNPIGVGMNSRNLIPLILRQIKEIQNGARESIQITRLDSKRDYINVKDVAIAIGCIVGGNPLHSVYNIGSGVSTSNSELLGLMIKDSKLKYEPKIVETLLTKEPSVAARADISRISSEFNWRPLSTLEETVKDIIHASK